MPLFAFPGSNSKRARAWGVDNEGDSSEGCVSGEVVVVESEAGGEGRLEDIVDVGAEVCRCLVEVVCGKLWYAYSSIRNVKCLYYLFRLQERWGRGLRF